MASAAACRRGSRHCRPAPALASGSWSRDLAPAANVQASECPDGTMPTLARGHASIVRCLPI
jgi:hypothetical protein